ARSGCSCSETLTALTLVGTAMTGLLVAFAASGQFGVLARRQATALMVARSLAGTLSRSPYTDTRLVNNNTSNDASTAFADPNGRFAQATMPCLGDPNVPGVTTITPVIVGNETCAVYVNVSPQMDPVNSPVEQRR